MNLWLLPQCFFVVNAITAVVIVSTCRWQSTINRRYRHLGCCCFDEDQLNTRAVTFFLPIKVARPN